jgi:hypothetical protein
MPAKSWVRWATLLGVFLSVGCEHYCHNHYPCPQPACYPPPPPGYYQQAYAPPPPPQQTCTCTCTPAATPPPPAAAGWANPQPCCK